MPTADYDRWKTNSGREDDEPRDLCRECNGTGTDLTSHVLWPEKCCACDGTGGDPDRRHRAWPQMDPE